MRYHRPRGQSFESKHIHRKPRAEDSDYRSIAKCLPG